MEPYIIKTERLGLRNWEERDIAPMISINQDPRVMEFFPSIPSPSQTRSHIIKMQQHFKEHGFCYFATDRLDNGQFIGFIGLLHQNWESEFTPCVDIGWRLSPSAWGKGFATEGALACLNYAFEKLHLKELVAIAPCINTKSISVMKKIGLKKTIEFDHPKLLDNNRLRNCDLYKKTK